MRSAFLTLFVLAISYCSFAQSRDTWQQPLRIMDSIDVRQRMVIGEIGAGLGYFTFRLAERVGKQGTIYANDIDTKALDSLKNLIRAEKLDQVIVVRGELSDPLFPDGKMDMIVSMLALHDIENPVALLINVKNDLKPGAPVVIIDRDSDKWPGGRDHFLSENKMLRIFEQAGYRTQKVFRFLPRDNIYVCFPL